MYGSGQLLLFSVCRIVTVHVTVVSNMCRPLECRILAKALYDTGLLRDIIRGILLNISLHLFLYVHVGGMLIPNSM